MPYAKRQNASTTGDQNMTKQQAPHQHYGMATEFYMSAYNTRTAENNMNMNTLEMKETRTAICKCGYQWETKSKMEYVTCCSCRRMTRIRERRTI